MGLADAELGQHWLIVIMIRSGLHKMSLLENSSVKNGRLYQTPIKELDAMRKTELSTTM